MAVHRQHEQRQTLVHHEPLPVHQDLVETAVHGVLRSLETDRDRSAGTPDAVRLRQEQRPRKRRLEHDPPRGHLVHVGMDPKILKIILHLVVGLQRSTPVVRHTHLRTTACKVTEVTGAGGTDLHRVQGHYRVLAVAPLNHITHTETLAFRHFLEKTFATRNSPYLYTQIEP